MEPAYLNTTMDAGVFYKSVSNQRTGLSENPK